MKVINNKIKEPPNTANNERNFIMTQMQSCYPMKSIKHMYGLKTFLLGLQIQ
jgi:hypothetical protein